MRKYALFISVFGIFITSLVQGQGLKYRTGTFLHHSVGANIWGPNGSPTSVPQEMVKYNRAHGLTGTPDSIRMTQQMWPATGATWDNSWERWHLIFDNQDTYVDIRPVIAANPIVMIKSCFISSLYTGWGSPADTVPPLDPNKQTVYKDKWHWRNIVRIMRDTYPNTFFIIWTNAPDNNPATPNAALQSHTFSSWAKDTLAAGKDATFGAFPNNVYVFDYFHLLADPVTHLEKPEYAVASNNPHPNANATAYVDPILVQEVFDAAIAHESGNPPSLPEPPGLGQPSNGVLDVPNVLWLSWGRADHADTYHLQVAKDTSFSISAVNDSTLTDSTKGVGPLENLQKYYWRVRSRNAVGASSWSEVRSFTTASSTTVLGCSAGWNLVSVPVVMGDSRKTSVFPMASSSAFSFQGNYIPRDTLESCTGYWLKFDRDGQVGLVGTPITADTVDLQQGWNLIGMISDSVPVGTIRQEPAGITSSNFFSYGTGYTPVNTLMPGGGYWIKASSAGKLFLSPGGMMKSPVAGPAVDILANLNRLIIRDAAGSEQALYFGNRTQSRGLGSEFFEMPPPGPEGMLDVRFSSNRIAEFSSGEAPAEWPVMIRSAAYPISIAYEAGEASYAASFVLNGKEIDLTDGWNMSLASPQTKISVRITGTPQGAPLAYSLDQNYPNPFNPITTIRFTMPEDANVRLAVYDVLGQRVKTLVDGVQPGGVKSAVWDATDDAGRAVASGIYIYRLEADGLHSHGSHFAQNGKMSLLR